MLLGKLVGHGDEVISFADYYACILFGLAELEIEFEDHLGRVSIRSGMVSGLEGCVQAR